MRANQIFRRILAAVFLAALAGCASVALKREIPKVDYWSMRRAKVSPAEKNRIVKTLYSVLVKARTSASMDSFGIGTMKEAIVILDNSHPAAPFIADAIRGENVWKKFSTEAAYWKFKFWCVDIAGYLKEKKIAPLLYKVAVDNGEKKEIRRRAVISLAQMRQRNFLRKLFETTREVELREEIAKAILKINQ